MFDIIIVGAGPAGLTSALYALRAKKKVLILEAKIYGGQIVNAAKIENYPGIKEISGFDFADILYNQVLSLGGNFKFETVISIDKDLNVVTNKNSYYAKAIILATGTQNRKLNIENEDKFIGKGVSYCTICDGNFFKGKNIALVGGGNTAIEDAIYLSDIVNHIYLIHRRSSFRAEKQYLDELKRKNNVELILDSKIEKINGKEFLESIDIINEKGIVTNKIVDGLFIAVGCEPKNQIFKNLIDINEQGYIISNDGVHTNVPHIYVAGDAREKNLRQLTTAVGDGAMAATTAIKELKEC